MAELIGSKAGLAARALDGSDDEVSSSADVQLEALVALLMEALETIIPRRPRRRLVRPGPRCLQRLHSTAQRLALGLGDGGCTAAGCDWPHELCHAHHDDPWHHGGHTNITDGRVALPPTPSQRHDPDYEITKLPDGKIAFTRRE